MNVVGKRLKSKQWHFITANDIITVDVNGNGPELLLSDGSSLIFLSDIQYYSVISDAASYNIGSNDIDIDVLALKYGMKNDDAMFDDIIEVEEFNVGGRPVYRFIRK